MNPIWSVYALSDPRDGTIFYVGISIYLVENRLAQHERDPKSSAFVRLRALRDLGLRGVVREIAQFETEEDARDYEAYLISRTPGLLNRSAPYGKHPDPTPTADPKWPVTGRNDVTYERLEPESEDEDFAKRVTRVGELLGGGVRAETIALVLRAMAHIEHEDAEFTYATDE